MKDRIVKLAEDRRVVLTPTRMYYWNRRGEYVLRIDLAEALLRGQNSDVATHLSNNTHEFISRGLLFGYEGAFQFGCCTFNKKEAAIVRKWAFAKKKTRKGAK